MKKIAEYLKEIQIEAILAKVKNKTDKRLQSYLTSYPAFIAYFKNKEILDEHDLIIASHFTYGWMPTALKLDENRIDGALKILNEVISKDSSKPICNEKLSILKSCINNSIVGVSKLLHFIRPDVYPIWDSKVGKALDVKAHQVNSVKNYKEYYEDVHNFMKQGNYDAIHNQITNKIGAVTKVRSIELLLFLKEK